MQLKTFILSTLLVFTINGCVGIAPDGKGYTITVPMDMISSALRQNFPKNQNTDYGKLLIDKPNILGKVDNDKLGIGTGFTFSNMLIPKGIKGAVSLSSGIRYDARSHGLYLANPMIDELKFNDFSLSSYLTPDIKKLIGNLITQQLKAHPIYHMEAGTASLVKNVAVQNGNVVVTVGF